MIIYDALFYVFAALLVTAAFGVVSFKNSMYSVLCLIFAFFNAAGLFVLLGAEFLAMALIIVYVGAVAVLFLFVVMMLNINISKVKEEVAKHRFLLAIIGIVLLGDLTAIIYTSIHAKKILAVPALAISSFGNATNTEAIGLVLYTNFSLLFEMSGLILLVAMIGAIVLTFRKSQTPTKRQDVSKQLRRDKKSGMELVSVKTGEGVDAI